MSKDIVIDPFVHSIPLELDWETNDGRMTNALEELLATVKIRGNQNKIKAHMRALLIACSRLQKGLPDYYLAYSRNNSFDLKRDHNNPFNLKMRSIRKVVDALRVDYLDHKLGFNYFGSTDSRRSRIRPNNLFINLMNKHDLLNVVYKRALIRGGIILKNKNKGIIYDYTDTNETVAMRDDLSFYNHFIEQVELSIKQYEGPWVHLYDSNRSYRVFNSGDFNLGGRFYGGWWQGLKSWQRRGILINGKNTVELDFKSNHLCFLYGLENIAVPEDTGGDLYNFNTGKPREIIKQLIMIALNTRSSMGAWIATKNHISEQNDKDREEWQKHIPNKHAYDAIVKSIIEAHPVTNKYFYRACGLRLMNLDSRVAEFVLMRMTEQAIPCLSIHDSFIVQEDKEDELRRAMFEAYDFIGYPLALPLVERV